MSNVDLKTLTSDLREHNIGKESRRVTEKWDKTGLLKGLKDIPGSYGKSNMARLLENQAAELLKESSTDASIKGFQNIAFPIVRRVFGGLIANELVSVQPMSLPSGLLFYLDYTFANANKGGNQALDWTSGGSVYGDQTAASSTNANENLGTGGHYYMNSSYSNRELTAAFLVMASASATWAQVNYDMELSAAVANGTLWYADVSFTSSAVSLASLDVTNYKNFSVSGSNAEWALVKALYKRHNTWDPTLGKLRVFYSSSAALSSSCGITGSYVAASTFTESSGIALSPVFESDFTTDMIP
jgi:hypothetical protein